MKIININISVILLTMVLLVLSYSSYSQNIKLNSLQFLNNAGQPSATKITTNIATNDSSLNTAIPTTKATNDRIRSLLSGVLTGVVVVVEEIHTVSTSDATVTTIDTLVAGTNTHNSYYLLIHGKNTTDGTLNRLRFSRVIDVSNVSGTVSKDFENIDVPDMAQTNISGCDIQFNLVSGRILVQVVGLAGKNINWTVVKIPNLASLL